jgi:hypothetical protein
MTKRILGIVFAACLALAAPRTGNCQATLSSGAFSAGTLSFLSTLFTAGMENCDLSEWDSTSGAVTATASAALEGSCGADVYFSHTNTSGGAQSQEIHLNKSFTPISAGYISWIVELKTPEADLSGNGNDLSLHNTTYVSGAAGVSGCP